MADENEKGSMLGAVLLGVLMVLTVVFIARMVGSNKAVIMNCMPFMGNTVDGVSQPKDEPTEEGFAPVSNYFDTDKLMPKVSSNDPEWAHKYAASTADILNNNFVDNAMANKYSISKSTCGRRYMSLDLRKTPVPTRDPTTVTSFNLPAVSAQCIRDWQDQRPSLDC